MAQRAHELAWRVALGASPILRRVLLKAEMAWVLAGIATGAASVLMAAPMAGGMLIFVEARDRAVIVSAITLFAAIALAAVIPIANRIASRTTGLIATSRDPIST